MGLVLQEPFLFSGTVLENIRYGRLDATEEEVEQAARAVGAHDFIARLHDGYHTELNERGQNLSVGQRQLVSFARGVFHQAFFDQFGDVLEGVQMIPDVLQGLAVTALKRGQDARQKLEAGLQRHHVPGVGPPAGDAAGEALQVQDTRQRVPQLGHPGGSRSASG